jgi:hypothetical protein
VFPNFDKLKVINKKKQENKIYQIKSKIKINAVKNLSYQFVT